MRKHKKLSKYKDMCPIFISTAESIQLCYTSLFVVVVVGSALVLM